MIAADILAELWRSDTAIRLTDDGVNLAVPAGRLTTAQRKRIIAHKPELLAFLHTARQTTEELLAAAMRACDCWQDSPQARQQMREQCLELPLHLHAELLEHLRQTYGKP